MTLPLLLAQILGAALLDGAEPKVWTWGDAVREWRLPDAVPRVLVARATGPGGCVDARGYLYVQERPGPSRFIRVRPPAWRPELIEPETEFADCLPVNWRGRRGVALAHHFAQVRFYEEPTRGRRVPAEDEWDGTTRRRVARGSAGEPTGGRIGRTADELVGTTRRRVARGSINEPGWRYEELYSIYTASQQGGLLERDVDRDGDPDLFIGNYWLRNPGRRGVAWRLFAVNLWHESPASARAAFAWFGDALVWAETTAARLALFRHPGDDRELWREERVAVELDQPRGLAVGDLDGDGRDELVVGDRRRVVVLRRDPAWRAETLATGFATVRLWVRGGRVVVAGADQVRVLAPRR